MKLQITLLLSALGAAALGLFALGRSPSLEQAAAQLRVGGPEGG